MKTYAFGSALILFILTLASSSRADLLIDSFATAQSAPGGGDTRNVASGNGILGGERDVWSFLTMSANGTVPGQLRVAFPNGLLLGRAGGELTYDGIDNNPSASSYNGLGSIDLTQGGSNDRFRFDITSVVGSAVLQVDVFSVNHGSTASVNLPLSPGPFDIAFSSFHYHGMPFSYPVDFHDVGYINIHFDMTANDVVVIDRIAAVPEPNLFAFAMTSGLVFCAGRSIRRRTKCPAAS